MTKIYSETLADFFMNEDLQKKKKLVKYSKPKIIEQIEPAWYCLIQLFSPFSLPWYSSDVTPPHIQPFCIIFLIRIREETIIHNSSTQNGTWYWPTLTNR